MLKVEGPCSIMPHRQRPSSNTVTWPNLRAWVKFLQFLVGHPRNHIWFLIAIPASSNTGRAVVPFDGFRASIVMDARLEQWFLNNNNRCYIVGRRRFRTRVAWKWIMDLQRQHSFILKKRPQYLNNEKRFEQWKKRNNISQRLQLEELSLHTTTVDMWFKLQSGLKQIVNRAPMWQVVDKPRDYELITTNLRQLTLSYIP